jgi:hypothetical protein
MSRISRQRELVRAEQTECDKAGCELYLFHTGNVIPTHLIKTNRTDAVGLELFTKWFSLLKQSQAFLALLFFLRRYQRIVERLFLVLDCLIKVTGLRVSDGQGVVAPKALPLR